MKKLILSTSENFIISKAAMPSISQAFKANKADMSKFYAKNARRGRIARVVQVVSK